MKNIHLEAVFHEPQSRFAYAYNEDELHIRLMTKRGSIDEVSLIYGDPFDWVQKNNTYGWNHQRKEMIKERSTDLHDYWQVSVQTKHKRFKYGFYLNNRVFHGANFNFEIDELRDFTLREQFNLYHFPFISKADITQIPKWVDNMIWYHIFPDRFASTNPLVSWETSEVSNNIIFGGNLKGIEEKLPYLKELGITGIYLNPIFTSPSAHKYDTKDYTTVDPTFGTNDDLKDLVKRVHELDMKIMIDSVFNHCGWEYPIFQDVVKNGKKSKYYDWFLYFDEPAINFNIINGKPESTKKEANYYTFGHVKSMPKWNTSNPDVQNHLISIAKEWVQEFDIDGIRHDVADEVAHDFWNNLNKNLKQIKPDLYHLGETWHNGNPYISANHFHSVMNYKLMLALEDYLTNKTNSTEFSYVINKLLMLYPDNVTENMFNVIDSHDTPRALSTFGKNTILGLIFLILFPGRPSIYYGTEMDVEGAMDPDNRRPFPWNKEPGKTYETLKNLIEIKKTYNPKKLEWIYYEDALIFSIDELLVLLSKENETIIVPEKIRGNYINLITNEKITFSDRLDLHETEFYILKKADF